MLTSILETLLRMLDSSRGILKKKASIALGSLSIVVDQELLKQILQVLFTNLEQQKSSNQYANMKTTISCFSIIGYC